MKSKTIILLFSLTAIARGWAAFLQPMILTIGAAIFALNPDIIPNIEKIPPIDMPGFPMPGIGKNRKKKDEPLPWERPKKPSINKPANMS